MGGIGWRMAVAGVVVGLAAGMVCASAAGLYEEDGVYRVETFQALRELSQLVASGEGAFTGEIWLTEDIEADGEIQPIGSAHHMFLGTFDGRGHSISGLRMEGCSEFAGLFGYIGTGGCVRNLEVKNALIMGSRYTGAVAAYNAGTIENCRVTDSCIVGTGNLEYGSATGGAAGLSAGNMLDCINEGSSVMGRRNVGGVTGSLCAGRMERCVSTGSVFSRDTGQALAGGVAGGVQTGGTMKGCISAGKVSAPEAAWTGGIAGGILSGEMTRCFSFSEVSGREAGSIAGYAARRAQIVACSYIKEYLPAVGEGREAGVLTMKDSRWIYERLIDRILGGEAD